MALKIGTIEYTKGDDTFESDEVKIISRTFHEESGGYKEPNDVIETVEFEAESEHGTITGQASARRSGFDTYFEYEDNVELSINTDDKTIELSTPYCTVEEDEDE
ncbi:MAG: hypothetical protein RBR07_00020 [Arcobacteraceae bacterium]|nr:hypothetical protein [Arcobacteraceae bacterium]